MKSRFLPLALAALFLGTGAPAKEADAAVQIEALEVWEFNAATAVWRKLSLYGPGRFYGVNWRSQEWGGSNDDLQILIPVTGPPSSVLKQPIVVTVSSRGSRKVIDRRRFLDVKIPASGRAYQMIHLRDAACMNLDVVATFGTQRERLILALECID